MSRNEAVARIFGDPTNDRRRRWMQRLGREPDDDLLVNGFDGDDIAFLVMGDTGEGDLSQYAVVTPMLSQAEGTSFLFLCSDVVYPAGGIEEYERAVFGPYGSYAGPLFAIPGNHDWYDDADGFMYWFCGARERPVRNRHLPPTRRWLGALLWRRSPDAGIGAVKRMAARREAPAQQATQPASYFAMDAGPLRLVALDAGLGGDLDRDQGQWLRRVSDDSGDSHPRPKILLTGKPLYADGRRWRRGIENSRETVNDIVADPRHGYIAVISGDVHNYQRYLVPLGDGRRQAHIVSGGGGAFMHATHSIPRLPRRGVPELDEDSFRCYPLRGDSLARYNQLYARKLGPWAMKVLAIAPDEAARMIGERIGMSPTRPQSERTPTRASSRLLARTLYGLATRTSGSHAPLATVLDWNQPPLFKHFLRVDADASRVSIRCHAATGCRDADIEPPVEDEIAARPGAGGVWNWSDR